MADNTVVTTDDTEELTRTQMIANAAVLTFAVIGAVQTTRFAITKAQAGYRYIKLARRIAETTPTPEETVAHSTKK